MPLGTKFAVIKDVNEGTRSKTEIARDYGIPKSTLYTILKKQEKYIAALRNPAVKVSTGSLRRGTHYNVMYYFSVLNKENPDKKNKLQNA